MVYLEGILNIKMENLSVNLHCELVWVNRNQDFFFLFENCPKALGRQHNEKRKRHPDERFYEEPFKNKNTYRHRLQPEQKTPSISNK